MALTSNQWEFRLIANHLVISAQVTDRSCDSEFAEMMVVDPIRVDNIQMVNHETSADLPIPRPEEVASLKVSKSTLPLFCLMWSRRAMSTSRCHLRGPVKLARGVPCTPHGNVNSTNARGSSLIAGDQRRLIRVCSSWGLYWVVCMGGIVSEKI